MEDHNQKPKRNVFRNVRNQVKKATQQIREDIQESAERLRDAKPPTIKNPFSSLNIVLKEMAIGQRFEENLARYRELIQRRTKENDYDGKPAVLVAGRTGSGKSTLVNTVLGTELALTGAGEPITMDFQSYSVEGLPIEIYDSPGWEGGKSKANDFIDAIKHLLHKNDDKIQVIWYVIDAQASRVVDFEIEQLKTLFDDKPICLVLNKCDIATDEQIIGILRAFIGANIPSQVGAYEVAAKPQTSLDDALIERFGVTDLLVQTYYLIGIDQDTETNRL
ncbi:MAG: hypothetical protein DPW16_04430 [Chloroflexi bacterium]|nr:hypothetical protein [Chloroflexota bacterium]